VEQPENELYRKYKGMEGTHICARCGHNLITIWDGTAGIWVLMCAHDHEHKGFNRRQAAQTMIARGELDTTHGAGAQAKADQALSDNQQEYSLMAKADIATGMVISPAQVAALVEFADRCGLRAYLGHVCLYFGKPYPTIDGLYWKKNRDKLGFMVDCQPMTDKERLRYMVIDGDYAFIAKAITTGGDVINTGIGIVTAEEMSKKSKKHPESFAAPIVRDHPQRMAEKRAEWQLLKKMVLLGDEVDSPEPMPRESSPREPLSQSGIDRLWE